MYVYHIRMDKYRFDGNLAYNTYEVRTYKYMRARIWKLADLHVYRYVQNL